MHAVPRDDGDDSASRPGRKRVRKREHDRLASAARAASALQPMPETRLHDLATFDRALQQPRVLLFKHSPVCPISADAHDQYAAFCRELPDVPTLFVDVIADRPVARGIAERCGVRHESPQAILFELGRPVWHASHHAITLGSLHAAWAPRC